MYTTQTVWGKWCFASILFSCAAPNTFLSTVYILHFVVLLQHLVALFCCKTGNFSVNVSEHWEVFLATKLCSKDLIWFSQNFFVPYHQFLFFFFFCFSNVLFGKVFLVDLCIIKKL